jgi:colicin import membrane protein
MSDRMPAAFVTSLFLHGLVVALMFLVAYSASFETKPVTKAFELVAGEGDNFGATEAPALGSPGGVKLNVPTPPTPRPEPFKPEIVKPEPAPVKPEPAPVVPTPPTPTPPPVPKQEAVKNAVPTPKSAPTKTKTISDQLTRAQILAESKIKQRVAREKAAEQKRLEKERQDQAKLAKAAAANAPRVDALGIAKGVLHGSTSNTEGGAGGKALTRSDGPVMEAYFAMLKDRLLKALDKPPGLSDTLVAEAEFRIGADGSISAVKIISPSGSAEFDRAVLEAYARVRMPSRPDGKSSVQTARFRTKDLEGG